MSRSQRWMLIALVILLSAGLRLWDLGGAPPGLSHDEVINGLVARDVLAGHHAIYFTSAGQERAAPLSTGGHEPLYQYVQAGSVGCFGENWIGIRWPSFAFSIVTFAAVYVLVRRLFDFPTALLTIAWLGISFWPLFYARVGLRAIALPCTATLCAYFLFQTIGPGSDGVSRGRRPALLTGMFLGLSLYTYMAARILPIIIGVLVVYLLLTRESDSVPWWAVISILLMAALIAAPLLAWLGTHPSAEERISEVREPLDRLLTGDPSLVWRNLVANLGFFTFQGDPWFHQGLPGRPVFAEPVSAALFIIGVAIAGWRWRQPQYGFLLIWLIGALIPSSLSSHAPPELASDAPSSIRNILGLTAVFVFPALALTVGARWLSRRVQGLRVLSRDIALLPLAAILLVSSLGCTVIDYFRRWSTREDVRYLYQSDLTAVGHWLDTMEPGMSVTVAGLSVQTLDRPTLEFTARADVGGIRLCDTRQTLIVPGTHPSAVLVPRVVPFDESAQLEQRLRGWAQSRSHDGFTSYVLSDPGSVDRHLAGLDKRAELPDGTAVTLPVSFGGRLLLLGYEWAGDAGHDAGAGSLLTYWRVETPPVRSLKAFLHLVDSQGQLIAQHDGLESPPQGWAPGDLIVQRHALDVSEHVRSARHELRVGIYHDTPQGERLLALTADYLLLYSPEG